MFKLLHRHIFREIAVATCMAMGLFVFILLTGNAIRDIATLVAAGKLDVVVFFKLIGLLVPYVAVYALPFGVLTGTLMGLGRLSSQQEITAMKAAGVSLWRISGSVFVISLIGMLLALAVNLYYAPKSKVAYKRMLASAVSENPVSFLESKRFIDEFPGYVIYMGDQRDGVMKDFWIWELDEERRVKLFLRAAEGSIDYNEAELSLVLRLLNGTAEQRDGRSPEVFSASPDTFFFEELPVELPLEDLFGQERMKRTKMKHFSFDQLLAAREVALEKERAEGTGISQERVSIQMVIQKNFAMAFSVFSLSIFGVPLAIQVGRQETSANLGIALVIALGYYFLMIVVSWFEKSVALRPDLLIWVPNLLFQMVGLGLIYRASRH